MNEVMKTDVKALVAKWNQEDREFIKERMAKGATEQEFKLFLYTAAALGLDPLKKEIWCVKYEGKPAMIYTSRDGFLSIAHRSGFFDGMETEALYEDEKLVGAKCSVWRKDVSRPFVVSVLLSEYDQRQALWLTKKETMIKKVAENQALRKAFNISGVYSTEEITEIEIIPDKEPSKQDKKREAVKEEKETPKQTPKELAKKNKNIIDVSMGTWMDYFEMPENMAKSKVKELIKDHFGIDFTGYETISTEQAKKVADMLIKEMTIDGDKKDK
jgi:phage recombination protein Bet